MGPSTKPANLDQVKYHAAAQWFKNHPKTMTALSGGVDSCLTAYLARHFLGKENAIAIIGDSPALKRRDLDHAMKFCHNHDIRYQTVRPGEIDDPRYNSNPENRCFWCKNSLYTVMKQLKETDFPEFTLINGNNQSDRGDYRPGLEAADQYQVKSPLADCGFEKDDIRKMAQYFQLKEWNKPASPCLSSRFPYGISISKERLKMVEAAENILTKQGFKEVRARYRDGDVSIEVPPEEIPLLKNKMPLLNSELKQLGFGGISIDQEGLVSGKLNRAIGK